MPDIHFNFFGMHSERPANITRRHFITAMSGIGAAGHLRSPSTFTDDKVSAYRAVLFDAFPIFDPRPVFQLVSEMFPEKGMELTKAWKTKQFEYFWLRAAGQQYKNFWEITLDALVNASKASGVSLSFREKDRLMSGYLALDVWPDVLPALQQLRQQELQLGFLSNMTAEMLTSCMKYSKTDSFFDKVLSTDLVKTYKPDPRAYQIGVDDLKLKKEEILFVAFAGWDVAGAKWFGYPTYWVNRLQSLPEELSVAPDGSGNSMSDLISFLNV
jgi:2-haloacid dehalogenase